MITSYFQICITFLYICSVLFFISGLFQFYSRFYRHYYYVTVGARVAWLRHSGSCALAKYITNMRTLSLVRNSLDKYAPLRISTKNRDISYTRVRSALTCVPPQFHPLFLSRVTFNCASDPANLYINSTRQLIVHCTEDFFRISE